MALGPQGVQRHQTTFKEQVVSGGLDGRDPMSCVVHRVLGQRHTQVRRER
ncbi:MAG: hypothetical protein AB7N91_17200 [Candidatus Tectimicrobiota bacterium]